MNGQLAQPATLISQKPNLPKNIVVVTLILIIGFILGFASRPLIISQKATQSIPTKSLIDESKLPISISLLNNPIVYEWRGSVKGKMTKKDADTFTLIDEQGNGITITDISSAGSKSKIHFFDKGKEASFSAIPVGSTLLGDFFIFKNGPNTPVGSSFVKQ